MFYANNEQVKGIFLNGRNFNYLAYGFSKIIPEDRNAEQLNLNLARRYLNKYRIEFGTVKDGYENALVSQRFDKPDSNGIFHTPFTYYYNGNIVPTKEVSVLITNGNYALRNALVYNDMNINGAINYFATNTDFQGHNVNVFKEADSFQVYRALLNYEMLNNCSNFDLNIETRFSKASYQTLNNCINFSGNFRYVGNQDYNYPGFRGFLYECKDGVFNINCTNMHGGGNDANVTNYFNFSGIQSCNNIKLNITGSSWQVWPHDHSFSSNCNINTYNVISGFSYMNYCNFNVELPKDSKPEMDKPFEFLNNAENCNYNLNALDSNLFNYRSGVGHSAFFDRLNNCNLNLLVNNAVSFDHTFGGNFNNCNIVFDNIKADLSTFTGWSYLNNCNITGNVKSTSSVQGFLERCDGINVNLNFAGSDSVKPLSVCRNVNGNIVLGKDTIIENVYDSHLVFNSGSFQTSRVNNCSITGFPNSFTYTSNCRFEVGLEEAIYRNSSYITWNNVWPHGFRMGDGSYRYLAGLKSVDGFMSRCSIASDETVFGGSKRFENANNMQTNLDTYYNGTVTANLPVYNMNIKFNVDCNILNLGVFQAGPPHGFQNATISANTIYAKGSMPNAYVQVSCDTKIYCKDYCNVAFHHYVADESTVLQPVALINNYKHADSVACYFFGGLARIGRLNYRDGMPADLYLSNGAFVFINNAVLNVNTKVTQNAVLFVGSNVKFVKGYAVESGGLVVNKANWSSHASKIMQRVGGEYKYAWNLNDSGPWGSQSLLDFCTSV